MISQIKSYIARESPKPISVDPKDIGPTMTDPRLEVLNPYTLEVLEETVEAAKDLPEGWELHVSAVSDVVLRHIQSGSWIGLHMKGLKKEKRKWSYYRGSVVLATPNTSWLTLSEAIVSSIHKFTYFRDTEGFVPSEA